MLNIGLLQRGVVNQNLAEQTGAGQVINKGVEFIKTGKELSDAIGKRIKHFDNAIALCRGIMKDCRTLIGHDPTVKSDYDDKMDYDGNKVAQYASYETSYREQMNSPGPSSVEKAKRKYNNAIYKIQDFRRRQVKLKATSENVKTNQRFKLSTYELEDFGFVGDGGGY